jgi:hypothetical protein
MLNRQSEQTSVSTFVLMLAGILTYVKLRVAFAVSSKIPYHVWKTAWNKNAQWYE